jgi:hypothetical protein
MKGWIFPWGIGSSSFWLAKLYMNKLPILSCRSAITLVSRVIAERHERMGNLFIYNLASQNEEEPMPHGNLVIVHGEVWSFFLGV